MNARSGRHMAAAAIALSMVMVACSPSTETTTTQGSSGTTTTQAGQSTSTTAEQPAQRGEVLRLALSSFAQENLNPLIMDGVTCLDLCVLVLDPLVMADKDGSPLPGVAESWEFDDDGFGVTFHIRNGMQFQNGDPLTAEDVVFTLQSWMDEELVTTATNPRWPSFVESPDDIELVDDHTVHISTLYAAESLIPFFEPLEVPSALILPKQYIEDVGWNGFNDNPIGSGPWKFESHTPGDEFDFTAMDSHPFRDVPSFDRLQVLLIPEAGTRESMLRNDEIDLANVSIESADDIDTLDNVRVEERFGGQITLMNMGTWMPESEVGPLANVKVREALSLAIDREQIVNSLFGGRGEAVYGSLPATITPGIQSVDYESWDIDHTLYDPDRAKELMVEAGYPDGFTLTVFTYPLSGAPDGSLLAEAFSSYWNELGVQVDITPVDFDSIETMSARPPLDPAIYGAMKIHRRPRSFSDTTSIGKYDWNQANGEAMLGPEGDGFVPDIHDRQNHLRELSGAERTAYNQELGELISSLWVSPMVLNYNATWGIGNNVGSWDPITVLSQVGMSLETAKPAS